MSENKHTPEPLGELTERERAAISNAKDHQIGNGLPTARCPKCGSDAPLGQSNGDGSELFDCKCGFIFMGSDAASVKGGAA